MIKAETRRALHELEDRLRPYIARRVSATDVDDVLQDVFLRVQRGLPRLREDEHFAPWVYRVARNAIVDHRRRLARHPLADGEPPEDQGDDATEEDDSAKRALALCVVPFVAALPSPYREAITLTELEGLSQKDAAAMLGVSLSGMKSRVQRGRAQLRRMFEDCCHIALDARGRVIGCEPRPGYEGPTCAGGRRRRRC